MTGDSLELNYGQPTRMKNKGELIKIAGYIILSISCILFILIPVIPWIGFSARKVAGIDAGLLIAGEILFYLSLALLGKSFLDKFKGRLKFRKPKAKDPDISSQGQ